MVNSIFGMAEKALTVSEDRANLISSNLVNSSTPGYKAKDLDFDKVMSHVKQNNQLEVTNSHHIKSSVAAATHGENIMYRIPMQSSMDGNTVDPELERKNFLQNAMKYQVSLTFIQNKADQLMKAMKGE